MQIIPLTVGPPSRAVVGQSGPEAMRCSRFILMEKGETGLLSTKAYGTASDTAILAHFNHE